MSLKYDIDGNLLWQKLWGGTGDDRVNGMVLDSSGNIYLKGETTSFSEGTFLGGWRIFLVKLDSGGNLLSQKIRDFQAFLCDFSNCGGSQNIAIDSVGNLYIASRIMGYLFYDVLLIKLDNSENILWQKRYYGGTRAPAGITLDSSGNVYCTGYWSEIGFLLKCDNLGNFSWAKHSQGPLIQLWGERAFQVIVDGNRNIFLAGTTTYATEGIWLDSGTWTVFDTTGDMIIPSGTVWDSSYSETTPNGIETTPNGSETYAGGNGDSMLIKMTP